MPEKYEFKTKDHPSLIIAIVVSTILLVLFLCLKSRDFGFMDLEVKWFIVAGFPILLCLFVAGYIKKVKGFGIELEAKLEEPVPASLYEKPDYNRVVIIKKGAVDNVTNIPLERRLQIDVLTFLSDYRSYFDQDVKEYLERLPNLRYIQLINRNGEFKYLLPVSLFYSDRVNDRPENLNYYEPGNRQHGFPDLRLIEEFIYSLERNDFTLNYEVGVNDFASEKDSIIEVYQKLKQQSPSFAVLPVLNANKKLIGIVEKAGIDAIVAEKVMKQIK